VATPSCFPVSAGAAAVPEAGIWLFDSFKGTYHPLAPFFPFSFRCVWLSLCFRAFLIFEKRRAFDMVIFYNFFFFKEFFRKHILFFRKISRRACDTAPFPKLRRTQGGFAIAGQG
jgi:hypothetical protein